MNVRDMLALANVLVPLIENGVTTFARMREFLSQEGATDEQLTELDARLSDAIRIREAELGLDPPQPLPPVVEDDEA